MPIPIGILAIAGAGAGVSNYWLALAGSGSGEEANKIVSRNGNIYIGCWTEASGAGSRDALIIKMSSAGDLTWSRTLGKSGYDDVASGIAVNADEDVYIAGLTQSEGQGGNEGLIAKYNSAGTIQWQRRLGGSTADNFIDCVVDSSGNAYMSGHSNSDGSYDPLLAKYNSSGTIQFQKEYQSPSTDVSGKCAIDSSDNIYIGYESYNLTLNGAALLKINSSGVLQWNRTLDSSTTDSWTNVATDSSGNVIAVGGTGSTVRTLIAKYNSSGTLQWQRVIYKSGTGHNYEAGVACDSSDNIYVCGTVTSAGQGSNEGFIAKYNSSGTLQWQRYLGTSGADSLKSIFIDSNNDIVVAGWTSGAGVASSDIFIAKLPNDGSLTGTYVMDGVNFVYAAADLTDETAGLSGSSFTVTASDESLTDAAATQTDASITLTTYKVGV